MGPRGFSGIFNHNALAHRSRFFPTFQRLTSNNAVTRASDKLFADAQLEESTPPPPRSSRIQALENEHQVWTGEESMHDSVLRMLVDKYKPLRTGVVVSADRKIKAANQAVPLSSFHSTTDWASTPLLPHVEGHRPWHSTYVAPSQSTISVRTGNFPPPLPIREPVPIDDRARRKAREEKKRSAGVDRLTRARESTLGYKLGLQRGPSDNSNVTNMTQSQANPVSMKGWSSLVEDKIERARSAGLFDRIKGRGKPLAPLVSDTNPFIGREEFLMNRIVQRNGAAPSWVDAQSALDTALSNWRDVLKQSLTRLLVRHLTLDCFPTKLTTADIQKLRHTPDMVAWEKRNNSYHETALAEVNKLVQDYNCLAPYPVRRAKYSRDLEMDKAYLDCSPDVIKEILALRLPKKELTKKDNIIRNTTKSTGTVALHAMESWLTIVKQWIDRWWK